MKKLLAVALALCLLVPCALAENIDLSGLSFAELAALRDRCQAEMMKRDEWQEVSVPQGLWEVGKDIPAGTWKITCPDVGNNSYLMQYVDIKIGDKLDASKSEIVYSDNRYDHIMIYNPNNTNYTEGKITEYVIKVYKGEYIYIHPQYNYAIFSPYTGKPDLGFK